MAVEAETIDAPDPIAELPTAVTDQPLDDDPSLIYQLANLRLRLRCSRFHWRI